MQTSDSRKRQAEAADVEALAEVLWAATVRGATAGEPLLHEEADNLAGAVLASGWLAADRARVRAETLAEVERGIGLDFGAVGRATKRMVRGMAEAGDDQ